LGLISSDSVGGWNNSRTRGGQKWQALKVEIYVCRFRKVIGGDGISTYATNKEGKSRSKFGDTRAKRNEDRVSVNEGKKKFPDGSSDRSVDADLTLNGTVIGVVERKRRSNFASSQREGLTVKGGKSSGRGRGLVSIEGMG